MKSLRPYVMEAAPYLGFIVQDVINQKNQEEILRQQAVEVTLENGSTDFIRPEAIFLRGVDELSTDDIKAFINYYVNFTVEKSEDDVMNYREISQVPFNVQWINDSLANIVFDSHDDVRMAFNKLSPEELVIEPEFVSNGAYVQDLLKERLTYLYEPIEAFKKTQSLFARIDKPKVNDDAIKEETLKPMLKIRQLLRSDQKVSGASKYSRYYLFNGDPERHNTWYRPRRRPDRDSDEQVQNLTIQNDDEKDLFADRVRGSHRSRNELTNRRGRDREEDEDLFADRLREVSPERLSERPKKRGRSGRRARNRSTHESKQSKANQSTVESNDTNAENGTNAANPETGALNSESRMEL